MYLFYTPLSHGEESLKMYITQKGVVSDAGNSQFCFVLHLFVDYVWEMFTRK